MHHVSRIFFTVENSQNFNGHKPTVDCLSASGACVRARFRALASRTTSKEPPLQIRMTTFRKERKVGRVNSASNGKTCAAVAIGIGHSHAVSALKVTTSTWKAYENIVIVRLVKQLERAAVGELDCSVSEEVLEFESRQAAFDQRSKTKRELSFGRRNSFADCQRGQLVDLEWTGSTGVVCV